MRTIKKELMVLQIKWVFGLVVFFGSGKSHFLKILAYLIENKQVKKKNAIGFSG